jgi:HAD superfamily hydrolase (TIGR01509 family)
MLVIFDCDGVLVDTETRSNAVLRDCLAELGVEMTLQEVMDAFMGRSWASCLQIAEDLLGSPPPGSFTVEYHRRRDDSFRDGTLAAVPGAPEAVDGVLDAGHDVCVASSGEPEKMAFTLNETGLWSRFAGRVFSAVEVERGKPAPDLFLLAADRMGREPGDCVVVEDAPAGVEGAKAAGMRVLGYAGLTVPEKLAAADAVFEDMARVPELV